MLHEFLTVHRDDIIARTRVKVAERSPSRAVLPELEHGVSLFLDQLAETLRHERGTLSRGTSEEIGRGAAIHGAELRRAGYTIAQVVHDYGDVCQAVTELAIELEISISSDQFKTLNRCLDEAIAQAVTEFARPHDRSHSELGTERVGVFAHELRNLVSNALLAFEILKSGTVGIGGSTGGVLGRSLVGLRDLIDRSLAEVRLEAGPPRREHVALIELLQEVELSAAIEANVRGVQFTVTPVEPGVVVDVDRQLVAAALANLLQRLQVQPAEGTRGAEDGYRDRGPGADRRGGPMRWPLARPGEGLVPSLRTAQRRSERAGSGPGHRLRERPGQRRRDPRSQPAGPGMHLHDGPAGASSGIDRGHRHAGRSQARLSRHHESPPGFTVAAVAVLPPGRLVAVRSCVPQHNSDDSS
jgi:hypothetical protein